MDILQDEQAHEIRGAVREFLSAESGPATVRAAEKTESRYAQPLWRRFAELGWIGLALPEDKGGQALALQYMGVVMEEAGRHLAPLPLHSTVVAALALDRFGNEAQRARLSQVATGDLLMAFALQERDGSWWPREVATVARHQGDALVLDGVKYFVDGVGECDQCLVLARVENAHGVHQGDALVLVDMSLPGIHVEELVATAADSHGVLRLRGVRVPATELIGVGDASRGAIAYLRNLAALSMSCLMAGAARRMMEMAVDYVNQREAFGQPIGAFQAIQHLAADMVNAVDGSEMLAREALWLIDNGLDARVEVSQAKSFASEKCLMVARTAQQFHGGIGFIAEFDLNLWYRRIASWSLRCGTAAEHRARIARALLDTQGEVLLGAPQAMPADAAEPRALA